MAPKPAEQDGKLVAGAIFFAVSAVVVLGGAWLIWPANFFDAAFSAQAAQSDMTPAMLLRVAISLALAVAGLEFLGALAVIALSDH